MALPVESITSPLGGGDRVGFIQIARFQGDTATIRLNRNLQGYTVESTSVIPYIFDFDDNFVPTDGVPIDTPEGVTLGTVTAEITDTTNGDVAFSFESDFFTGPRIVAPFGFLVRSILTKTDDPTLVAPLLGVVSEFEGSPRDVSGVGSRDGLPPGGDSPEVLGKLGPEDYNVGWVAPAAGGGGGLGQSQVQRLIASEVETFAQTDETAAKIPNSRLNDALRDSIDGSADASTLSISGGKVRIRDNEGTETTADLPEAEAGGLDQAAVDARITTLRPNAFTLAEQTKLRGIETGANVNVDQDNAANLLEYTENSTYTLNATGTAGESQDTGIKLEDGDQTISLTVGADTTQLRFDSLADVEEGVNIPIARTDIVSFQLGAGNDDFYAGKNAAGNLILAAGDVSGSWNFAVVRHGWRGENFADRRKPTSRLPVSKYPSSLAQIPAPGNTNAGKVPKPDASGVITWQDDNTGGGGGGLNTSQVNTLIDNRIPVARRVPSFAQGDAGQVLTVNQAGTATSFEPASGGLDQAAVDARIKAEVEDWAEEGALTGATTTKVQDIIDSFVEGGWEDISGALTAVPTVSTTTFTTRRTLPQLAGLPYALVGQTGSGLGQRYFGIRVPAGYELGIERLRLRVGVGVGSEDEDPNLNSWYPFGGLNIASGIRQAGFDYYQAHVNLPAGTRWAIQQNEPNTLNPNRVSLPDDYVGIENFKEGVVHSIAGDTRTRALPQGDTFDFSLRVDEVFRLTGATSVQRNDRLIVPTTQTRGNDTLISYDLGEGLRLSAYSHDNTFGTDAFITLPRTQLAQANRVTEQAAYANGAVSATYTVSQTPLSVVNFRVSGFGYANMIDQDGNPIPLWTNERHGNQSGRPWRAQASFAADDYRRTNTGFVPYALGLMTSALRTKLNALPSASDLEFDNHPIGTAAALNALSRTTSSLDFVTITANITSGITANIVYDGFTNTAVSSVARGDLLVLDHDNNRWVRVANLGTSAAVPATISQAEAEGGVDTNPRLTTGQRIRQAIVAWWGTVTIATAKIANLAVTTAKLANNAVTRGKLAVDQQVPALTGQAGKILEVNSGATALEFVDKPTGGGGGGGSVTDDAILDLADATRDSTQRGLPLGTSPTNENMLAFLSGSDVFKQFFSGRPEDADQGKLLGVNATENELEFYGQLVVSNVFPATPVRGDRFLAGTALSWVGVAIGSVSFASGQGRIRQVSFTPSSQFRHGGYDLNLYEYDSGAAVGLRNKLGVDTSLGTGTPQSLEIDGVTYARDGNKVGDVWPFAGGGTALEGRTEVKFTIGSVEYTLPEGRSQDSSVNDITPRPGFTSISYGRRFGDNQLAILIQGNPGGNSITIGGQTYALTFDSSTSTYESAPVGTNPFSATAVKSRVRVRLSFANGSQATNSPRGNPLTTWTYDGENWTAAGYPLSRFLLDFIGSETTPRVARTTADRGKHLAVSATNQDQVVLVDAPTGGGTATTPGIKLVSLTTPAGDTATGGSHTNRKVINSGNIAKSAWSALALTADATAVRGITVASNAIVFANASQDVTVTVSMEFNSAMEGNTTRMYNKVRGALTRASTTTHPLEMRSPIVYTKVRATQGVATQCVFATWDIEVQAGDTLQIEWECDIQNGTYVDVVPANSQVKVKLR